MAQNSGVVRRIDDLGRIVIPKEYRNSIGIKDGEPLEMTIDGGKIVIGKYSKSCVFCGEVAQDHTLLGKPVCSKCRNHLREQVLGIG